MNKSYKGIVEITSIDEDGNRSKTKTYENIVTGYPFSILSNYKDPSNWKVAVMDSDSLVKDLPWIPVVYSLPGTKRFQSSNVSKYITPESNTTEDKEISIVSRFSSDGTVRNVHAVFFEVYSNNYAYVVLDVPYVQTEASSLEVKYRILQIIDDGTSPSMRNYWRTKFYKYQYGSCISSIPANSETERLDLVSALSVTAFNPRRDGTNVGRLLRSISMASGYNTKPNKLYGMRPIGGLNKIPGMPVGNVFNHSVNCNVWYEDLSNLASGKGSIEVGSNHSVQYLEGTKADMHDLVINKTGELGEANYTFRARPIGQGMDGAYGSYRWGLLESNSIIVEGVEIALRKTDNSVYGIDGSHLIIFDNKRVLVQHVSDMKIRLFDSTTYPALDLLTKMVSVDRTSDGTVYATNGTTLFKIENITSDAPTFSVVDPANFNNEIPRQISVSDTHLFVVTNTSIHQADPSGINWSVKVALPAHFNTNNSTEFIVNGDETEAFARAGNNSYWWTPSTGVFVSIGNIYKMAYSERFESWVSGYYQRQRRFNTTYNTATSAIAYEFGDTPFSLGGYSVLRSIVNTDPHVTKRENTDGLTEPVNRKISSCTFYTNRTASTSGYTVASGISGVDHLVPEVKQDVAGPFKEYRYNPATSQLEEGHTAKCLVSSGSISTDIPRKFFSPDSYEFKGWQYLDISENIKTDLSSGFSIAMGVTHQSKRHENKQGHRQTLIQIPLTKYSGISLEYRNGSDNMVLNEMSDDRTSSATTVSSSPAFGTKQRVVMTFEAGVVKIYIDNVLLLTRTLPSSLNIDNSSGSMKAYIGLYVRRFTTGSLYEELGLVGLVDNLVIYNKALSSIEVDEDYTNGVTSASNLVLSRALLTEELNESKILTATESTPLGINLTFQNTTSGDPSFVKGDYYNYTVIDGGFLKDNVTEFNIAASIPYLPQKKVSLAGTVSNSDTIVDEPWIPNIVDLGQCTGFRKEGEWLSIDTELFNDSITAKCIKTSTYSPRLYFNNNFNSDFSFPSDRGELTTVNGKLQFNGVDVRDVATITAIRPENSSLYEVVLSNKLPPRVHRLGDTTGTVKNGAHTPDFQRYERAYNGGVTVKVDGTDREVIINNDITANVASGTVNLSLDRSLIKFNSSDVGKEYVIDELYATVRGFYAGT